MPSVGARLMVELFELAHACALGSVQGQSILKVPRLTHHFDAGVFSVRAGPDEVVHVRCLAKYSPDRAFVQDRRIHLE